MSTLRTGNTSTTTASTATNNSTTDATTTSSALTDTSFSQPVSPLPPAADPAMASVAGNLTQSISADGGSDASLPDASAYTYDTGAVDNPVVASETATDNTFQKAAANVGIAPQAAAAQPDDQVKQDSENNSPVQNFMSGFEEISTAYQSMNGDIQNLSGMWDGSASSYTTDIGSLQHIANAAQYFDQVPNELLQNVHINKDTLIQQSLMQWQQLQDLKFYSNSMSFMLSSTHNGFF